MAKVGFYNDNEYRQYPFVLQPIYNSAELPTELIVDCGFIMGLNSGFDATAHIVYLYSVTKANNKLKFLFKTNAPGAVTSSIEFEREIPASEWEYEYSAAIPASNTALNNAIFCATEPLWAGFIVTGRLNEFAAGLLDNTTYTFNQERAVEPGRIQSLIKTYLRSVSVGNYARTVIQPCDADPSLNIPFSERPIIINADCITGPIQLKAGFNCEIFQDNDLNDIRIAPNRGANTTGPTGTEFCENGSEIKLYSAETPPAGSKLLSGGPACDEVITSINGLPGPDVKIVGGAGIQFVVGAAAHTLRLKRIENLLS
jgi:hypothetical protein